ncbi:A/G-specific adenine glycosylase [Candidatus Hodarchaeum mangrovi]
MNDKLKIKTVEKDSMNSSSEDNNILMDRFRTSLISWFSKEGRDLPWRHTRDPYHILVSEIMLQQTNVGIVIPIYKKFIKKFPTLQTLSQAPLSQVKILTDQLGYKKRGEYLHRIAKQIMDDFNGEFPKTLEGLLSLKGIGRYTAGAILSFAFGVNERTAAIVDVNVERVLSRVFGVWDLEKNSNFNKIIWRLSEDMLDEKNVWEINQGIMDLGALICISKNPKCLICPMKDFCKYYNQVVPKIIPLDNFFNN